MSVFTKTAVDIFASHDAAGAARKVSNHAAQVWGTEVERAIQAFEAGAGVVFDSKTEADGSLDYDAYTMAWVFDDDPEKAGIYQKQGESGSGSWQRVGELPYSFIPATNTNSGDANAIEATTAVPIPAADGAALIALPIVEDNTSEDVTVSFNGATALSIKTNSGNKPAVGGLKENVTYLGRVAGSGTTFRLLSDQASAAIVAAAEAAQAAAEQARDEAEAAAASAANNVETRVELKALNTGAVTSTYLTESGREGQFVFRSGDYSTEVTADPQEGVYIAPDSDPTGASGAWVRMDGGWRVEGLNVAWFGTTANAVEVDVTGSITSGTAALTAAGASFTADDVGKTIAVPGAGVDGAALVTTIASYTSATEVTLADNASTTLSSADTTLIYGASDAPAIQAAVNLARHTGVGWVRFPVPDTFYFLGETSIYLSEDGTRDGDPAAMRLTGGFQGDVLGDGPRGVMLRYIGDNYAIHGGRGAGGEKNTHGAVIIEDIILDGAYVGNSGLYLKRTANYGATYYNYPGSTSGLYRVNIQRFTGSGAYLFKCYGIPIVGSSFLDNGGWGIELDNCNGFAFGPGSKASRNTFGGLRYFFNSGIAGDGESDAGGAAAAGAIHGSLFELNIGAGIQLEGAQSLDIAGNYLEGNSSLEGGAGQIRLRGSTGNTSGDKCIAVDIHGNRFQASGIPDEVSDFAVQFLWAKDCSAHNNQTRSHGIAGFRFGPQLEDINYIYENSCSEDIHYLAASPELVRNSPSGSARYVASDVVEGDASQWALTDLGFQVEAGKRYEAEWTIYFTLSSTSGGIALGVNGPTASAFLMGATIPTGTTSFITGTQTAYLNAVIATSSPAGTAMATLRCYVVPTADGVLLPTFRVNDASYDATVKAGSFGHIKEIVAP